MRVTNHNVPKGEGRTRLLFQEPKTSLSRRTIPIPEECLAALKQHKARQAAEMAAEMQVKEWNQHFEERLLQRLEELKNDGRQSEEAIERWKYEHHLPSSRAEIRPIPPTHPPDDRPIDI